MTSPTGGSPSLAARALSAISLVLLLAACSPGDAATADAPATTGGPATEAAQPGGTAAAPSTRAPEDVDAVSDAPGSTTSFVAVSFAQWDDAGDALQAGGYVSPVVEDGGTCTLSLRKEQRTVEAGVTGVADATTTVCGGFSVPAADLSPGTWTVVLRYDSATTSGSSEPISVEVPS